MPPLPAVGPPVLLLAKATLLLLAAAGAARMLRRAPAGARHLVWLGALGALLVVPALDAWGPLRLAVLPTAVPSAAVTTGVTLPDVTASATGAKPAAAPAGVERISPRSNLTDAIANPAHRGVTAPSVATGLLVLWAGVALTLILALGRSWLAVRQIVRRARPLDTPGSPEWRDALYEVADRLGLADAPRLVRSDAVAMPFACGLRRPTVVLPAASDAWTPERRRAVLLHELAHVRRRDLAAHTLARVVCAAYWFHPLVWTAARRLRAESERACDDLALAAGTPAADYAEHLLEIVAAVRRDRTPAVALAIARRREFEGRVLDILDPERPWCPASRRQLAALAGALALVTTVVGAIAPADAMDARGDARGDARAVVAARDAEPADPATRRPATRPAPEPRSVRDTVGDADVAPTAAPHAPVGKRRAGAPPPHDARHAADSVGRGDARAALLARVLREDTSAAVRRDAAWGLAGYPADPTAAAALAAALRVDRDGAVREMSAWGLAEGDNGHSDGDAGMAPGDALDALTAALRADPDAGVRATAAWVLGTRGTLGARGAAGALVPVLVPALVAALGDASPPVRARAAWALGTLGDAHVLRRAPAGLVTRLGDGDVAVRALAAWALFAIADPSAVPALERALHTERNAAVQQADVRALGAFGAGAAAALRPLLDAPDPQLRAAAVRALAGGNAATFWPWPWPRPRFSPSYRADLVPLYLIH